MVVTIMLAFTKNNPGDNSVLLALLDYIFSKPVDKATYIYLKQKSKEPLSSFKDFVDLIPAQDGVFKKYIYRYYANKCRNAFVFTVAPVIATALYFIF